MEQNELAVIWPQRRHRTRREGLTVPSALATRRDNPEDERLIRLGDLLPLVPAQIWRQHPDEAMLMLTDYLAMLRAGPESSSELAVASPAGAAHS